MSNESSFTVHSGIILAGEKTISLPWTYDLINKNVQLFLAGIKQEADEILYPATTYIELPTAIDKDTKYEVYLLKNVSTDSVITDTSQEVDQDSVTIPGATLTGSGLIAETANIDELVLNGKRVLGISHDSRDSTFKLIPSSRALKEGLDNLQDQITDLDPDNQFLVDNTVITLNLISPTFGSTDDWEILSWAEADGAAIFTGGLFNRDNYISIPTEKITSSGTYFFLIDVARLDSGKLLLLNEEDEILDIISSYGIFPIEVNVENSDIATFKLVATDVYPNEVIKINSILFHRVTPRLKSYLDYKLTGSSLGQPITLPQMTNAISTAVDTASDEIHNTLDPLLASTSAHLGDTGNPHGVTPGQIGASPTNHAHTPESIGAAEEVHLHSPEECGAAPVDHTHTLSALGVAPVNHTHTPEECSAAHTLHGHLPEECGAASIVHTHDLVSLGASSIGHTHSPSSIGAADMLHTHSPEECSAAPVVHTHTPESIGAANESHTHTPAECGAAATNHTHSDYLSAITVVPIIKSSMNSLPTYGSEILSGTPSISLVNDNYEYSHFPLLLKTKSLLHTTKNVYDPKSGLITCNVEPDTGYPLESAFRRHFTVEDFNTKVAAFVASTFILSPIVHLTYEMVFVRSFRTIRLHRDTSVNAFGAVIEMDILIDGNFVFTFVDGTWFATNNYIDIVLPTEITGRVLTFSVKHVDLNVSSMWGMNIELDFTDVASSTAVRFDSDLVFSASVDDIPVEVSLTGDTSLVLTDLYTNLPKYLYIDFYSDPVLLANVVPPIYSDKYIGSPAMQNKFLGKTHPKFGTIAATNEVAMTNPVEFVYDDTNAYWKTSNGITTATITHTFTESTSLKGIRFVFDKLLASSNLIPNSINVTISDGSTVTTLMDMTSYFPGIPKGKNSHILEKILDTEISCISITVVLAGTDGQTALAISQMVPLFECIHYNTKTKKFNVDNILPIGRVDVLEKYDNSSVKWLSFTGIPFGNEYTVPVNGLVEQTTPTEVHILDNYFHTRNVDVEVFSTSNGYIEKKSVAIKITDTQIVFTTTEATSYFVKVSRK